MHKIGIIEAGVAVEAGAKFSTHCEHYFMWKL